MQVPVGGGRTADVYLLFSEFLKMKVSVIS